jgi:hypothetical protein
MVKSGAPDRVTDRKVERLVRKLASHLDRSDLAAFEGDLCGQASPELIEAARSQKLLTRGDHETRAAAGRIFSEHASTLLDPDEASEFGRYASLCIEASAARDGLTLELTAHRRRVAKLSLRQLLHLADRTFERIIQIDSTAFPKVEEGQSTAENERRIHAFSGYANDAMFAILRALNEAARDAGVRELRRPDAFARSLPPFLEMVRVAGLLNSLDYVLDSASFGEFVVADFDPAERRFILGFADIRRSLLRQLSIRRKLVQMLTGHRQPRFVREQLRNVQTGVLNQALNQYLGSTGVAAPTEEESEALFRRSELVLRQVEAEDDLIVVAAAGDVWPSVLYHVSACLRWNALAADLVAQKMPASAKRSFGRDVELSWLLDALPREEERLMATEAWKDLTVELPARNHFEIIRRPFVRLGEGLARPVAAATIGTWTTTVREILNQAGDVGHRYGAVWEQFIASGLKDTDWKIVGRNIRIVDNGKTLTEVDLLLLREDLLLVVELKALTGSGVSPYDHWKNRMVIEKGCRQAGLAADHLRRHPQLIASIANKQAAQDVRHVQPLVLTSENDFDGWEHDGVPVAGETIRKAITVGTKVNYYDPTTLKVERTDTYLRKEDLNTETILAALRNPIELQIALEQGAVQHHRVLVGALEFLVPDIAPGAPPVPA